ncbi:LysR family transcriptional regulator [Pelagibius sp. Alg239-R121]|uniref:LysR family transcriptional regulator n=1 Tax=Pelagibius sp. Alg239-R121 TaxID=2993448 RepID=UPI0024A65468|nr:LysR family transcriptional regulator [Pelagibius sp. Alg239-R121]
MSVSLKDMMVLSEVVETGSFTAASDRLGRTKSSVSQSVTRLEKDLGVRLILRTTRRLTLTDAGERFYRHCTSIREIHKLAQEDAREESSVLSGRLNITAPHALASAFVRSAVESFLKAHPAVGIGFLTDDRQINLVDHSVDVAIRVGMPRDQSLKVSKLGEFHDLLCAHKNLVTENGGLPKSLAPLADWNHIGNEWQGTQIEYRRGNEAPIRVTPHIRCNAFNDVLAFLRAGCGVALLPDIAVRDDLVSGNVVSLFPNDSVVPAAIYAAHAFDSFPPKRVSVFVSHLKSVLAEAGETGLR